MPIEPTYLQSQFESLTFVAYLDVCDDCCRALTCLIQVAPSVEYTGLGPGGQLIRVVVVQAI